MPIKNRKAKLKKYMFIDKLEDVARLFNKLFENTALFEKKL